MTERQQIINALLNVEKEEDFNKYLIACINEINVDMTKPVTIMTNGELSFINKMYPNVTLINFNPNNNLLFFNVDDNKIKNYLTYSFSIYDNKKADFVLGLGKDEYGVYTNQIDKKNLSKIHNQIHPYTICHTTNIDNIQTFLEMISKDLPKTYDLDLYVPINTFNKLQSNTDINYYNKLAGIFSNILLYNSNKSIQTVTYNENGRVLRIKIINTKELDFIKLLEYSLPYILVDINDNSVDIQAFIDNLSNFHEKTIFTSNQFEFLINLKKYTKNSSFKSLKGYKYKNELLDVCTQLKPLLDPIIKLGILQPKIQDILDILNDQHLTTYNKLTKLFNLFK